MTQLQTTELRLVTLLQSNIGMRHGAVRTQLVTMELIPQKSIIILIFKQKSKSRLTTLLKVSAEASSDVDLI